MGVDERGAVIRSLYGVVGNLQKKDPGHEEKAQRHGSEKRFYAGKQ